MLNYIKLSSILLTLLIASCSPQLANLKYKKNKLYHTSKASHWIQQFDSFDSDLKKIKYVGFSRKRIKELFDVYTQSEFLPISVLDSLVEMSSLMVKSEWLIDSSPVFLHGLANEDGLVIFDPILAFNLVESRKPLELDTGSWHVGETYSLKNYFGTVFSQDWKISLYEDENDICLIDTVLARKVGPPTKSVLIHEVIVEFEPEYESQDNSLCADNMEQCATINIYRGYKSGIDDISINIFKNAKISMPLNFTVSEDPASYMICAKSGGKGKYGVLVKWKDGFFRR